jgi:inorganic triphosphatase YgiF
MMEIELQLLMDPAHNAQLLKHPLIRAHARGPARTDDLTAHYFDTPDLHLMRHRAGLRVRQMDGIWIQTMKAGGSTLSGLQQQHEWETPVTRAWPQLGKLRKAVDDKRRDVLALPDLKNHLEVLFTVAVQRTRWDIDFEGTHIELALDHGHIEREGQRVPVNEVELELKSGTPASLFSFALRLLDDIPLRLSYTNKALRGYALCHNSGVVIAKATPVALPHEASTAQALVTILSNCLQQIQGNEAGVTGSADPESVHQMRVGVRRLRSALKLFCNAAPCPATLRTEIEWLGSMLGAARDWEVLRDISLPRVPDDATTDAGLASLRVLAQQTAREQRAQAVQAILSPRYTRLQLSLALWMREISASNSANDDAELAAPVAHFAHRTMRGLHKKMLRRAEKAASGEERAVHRLRIAGKRVRYALEFFAVLYRQASSARYLEALTDMQDALGRHNDVMVADRLLRELEQSHAISFARGYLLGQASAIPGIDDFHHLGDASHLPRRA